MSDLFENTNNDQLTIDPEKNYYDELVGEGKKFSTPEDLARGKAESDAFIAQLQREQAELREDLKQRQTMQEVVDQLNQRGQEQRQEELINQNNSGEQSSENAFSQEDVAKIIEEELRKRDSATAAQTAEQRRADNFKTVSEELRRQFGNNYPAELKKRAEEAGLDPAFVNEAAHSDPASFYRMLGVTPAQRSQNTQVSPPASSVNSGARVPNTSNRDKNYYDRLRRENPTAYFSPSVQREMFDKLKAGTLSLD